MIINISDNWLPTSENINALPRPVRDLFMRLHANTDPAGELRRAMVAEMELKALRKMIDSDAARYRWLRRTAPTDHPPGLYADPDLDEDGFDALIDEAMRQEDDRDE